LTQQQRDTEGFAKGYPGKTYEVNINADPEHFLDWDKPLSEQTSEIQQKLKDAWLVHPDLNQDLNDWHNTLRGWESERSIAEARQAGIPGIKYLDQGSRAAGGQLAEIAQFASGPNAGKWKVRSNTGEMAGPFNSKDAAQAYFDKLPKSTYNYVVFDDKLIDIIKKYGIAGLIGANASNWSPKND
jgi:hypothetical protein